MNDMMSELHISCYPQYKSKFLNLNKKTAFFKTVFLLY